MGSIDTGGKGVDVHLNITPFVDLMVCLTAFLLVTAVWTNLSQISIKPKGVGNPDNKQIDEEQCVKAALEISKTGLWLGVGKGANLEKYWTLPPKSKKFNWAGLKKALKEARPILKRENASAKCRSYQRQLQIGAADKITYQSIIWAMDTAISMNFSDVGLTDPLSLDPRHIQ